jgi:hypothetical protein
MKRLKQRWGISSNFQFFIILLVFAITGSLSAWVAKPICATLGITKASLGLWYFLVYIVVIMPVYKILLLLIGTIFGQHRFFKSFLQKMLSRLGFGFLFK